MEEYSVLMSTYAKDRPEWLRKAAESMLSQSLRPFQFVLVEDGPLTEGLYAVIEDLSKNSEVLFDIVQIPVNGGLGPALNEGLRHCRYELVARMDADDISLPDRCEKQVKYFAEHPSCDALSGTLIEFEGRVSDNFSECTRKSVPLSPEEVRKYAPMRNPMNHPCVMFRKSSVEKAGGYRHVPLFEDYDLWLRMIFDCGMELANLSDELLLMRTDGMYERRGGVKYAKHVASFRRIMYRKGYIGLGNFIFSTEARIFMSLIPGSVRKKIYHRTLRNSVFIKP